MASVPRYFSGFDTLSTEQQDMLMADASPAHLLPMPPEDAANKTAAVVCVHGFTGVPYEVMPVARACAEAGMGAIAPLLPGHGYRHFG
ncbi:MAG: hypothetical protein AAFU53_17535 [Cyanobacteria bacterium J06632_3]